MDLDGDGHQDMLSGSYMPGDLYCFAGSDKGFAAAQILKGMDGKNLNVGFASTVFAADWDRDGDLDLLVGNIKGKVFWIANEGSATAPAFANPAPILVDGEPLVVHFDAGPCVADWDGDGRLDLLVGDDKGVVTFFRNTATQGMTQLAAGVILVPGSKLIPGVNRRGIRSKVCVADWNEDGHMDLLLGDISMSTGEEPKINPAQKAQRDAARLALEPLNSQLNRITQDFIQDFRKKHGIAEDQRPTEQQDEELILKLFQYKQRNERYQTLKKEQEVQKAILKKLETPIHRHGHVWVFLRRPIAGVIMEADAQRAED